MQFKVKRYRVKTARQGGQIEGLVLAHAGNENFPN